MPALAAPLFGFVFGVSFAWLSREQLSKSDRVVNSSFVVVCLFALLVYAPFAAHFLAFAPDWSLAYLIAPERLPPIIMPGLILACAASVPLGFVTAAGPASAKRLSTLLRICSLPIVLGVGSVIGTLPRLAVYATHAQYQGDFGTEPLAGSALGYALVWMLFMLCCATLWTVRILRSESRASSH